LAHDCGEAHRGAFWWDEEHRIAVVFGNDGLPSSHMTEEYREESRRNYVTHHNPSMSPDEWVDFYAGKVDFEIGAVRELLARFGGREVAFTASREDDGWMLVCDLFGSSLVPDILEGVLWKAWMAIGSRREHDPEPVTLNWEEIDRGLKSRNFTSIKDCFIGVRGNIARHALERNGLR
jgi:hypothetical protein